MTQWKDPSEVRLAGDGRAQTLAERLRLISLEEQFRAQYRYLVLGLGEVGQQVVRSAGDFARFFAPGTAKALYTAALISSGSGTFDLTDVTGDRRGETRDTLDSGGRRGLHGPDLPNAVRAVVRRALQDRGQDFPQPDTILFVDVVYDLCAQELRAVAEAVPGLVAHETGRSDLTLFLVTDRRLDVRDGETSPSEVFQVATGFQRCGYHRVYCVDSQDTRRLWLPATSNLIERIAQFVAARCSPILSFHIRSGELSSLGRVMPDHLVQGSFGVARLRGGLGEVERIVRHLVAQEMGATTSGESAADGLAQSVARSTANWLLQHPDAPEDEIRARLRDGLGRLADGTAWRELVARIRSFLLSLAEELERNTVAFAFQVRRYHTDRALNQVITRTYRSEEGQGTQQATPGRGGDADLGTDPSDAGHSLSTSSPPGGTGPRPAEPRFAPSEPRRATLCLPGLIPRKVAATLLVAAALLAGASALVPIVWAAEGTIVLPTVATLIGMLVAAGGTWLEWGRGPYRVHVKPGRSCGYVRARRRYAYWLGFPIALAGSLLLVWSARVPSLLNFVPLAFSFPLIGPFQFYHVFLPASPGIFVPSIWVSVGGLLVVVGVATRLLWPDRVLGRDNPSSAFGWRFPWVLGSVAAGVGVAVSSWQCWEATRWYLSWLHPNPAREIALEVLAVLLQIGGVWITAYRAVEQHSERHRVPPPPLRQPKRPSTDLVVAWARNLAGVGPSPVPLPARAESIFDLICPGWAEQIADACLRELRGLVGSGLTERWAEELVGEFGSDRLPRRLEEVLADSAVSYYLRGDYRRWLIAELLDRGRPLRLAADAIVPLQWPPGYFRPHRDILLLVAPPRIVRIQLQQPDGTERKALLELLQHVAAEETVVYAVRFAQGAQKSRAANAHREAEVTGSTG